MEEPLIHETASLIQYSSKLVKVELNMDDSNASNAGFTIKEEPYDPSYGEFERTPQTQQQDTALRSQSAADSSFSMTQVKLECDQDNSAIETDEHLFHIKTEPEAEPDAEMTEVEDESSDEEEDKELQQFDVQSTDSSSRFSTTYMKHECEQNNSAIETGEHLFHIKTEPDAEPDESLMEVKDEASVSEEEDKELQQFDVQGAESSSRFSMTYVKQECEQDNNVTETGEHLLHTPTEPEAEPDAEMMEVKDEASVDEEDDKELQQSNVGSEPEEEFYESEESSDEECYESEEASDEDEPRHKRIKTAHHLKSLQKCLHCQNLFEEEECVCSVSDLPSDQATRLFKCNLCTLVFKSSYTLSEHVKFCYKINCRCIECGLGFNSLKEMYAHRWKIHVYKCDECNMRVNNRFDLHKHMVSDHGAVNKCFVCGLEVKTISEMRKHSLDTHGSIMPFNCVLCDKIFKTKFGLILHMSSSCKGKKLQDESQDVDTLDEPSFSAPEDFSSQMSKKLQDQSQDVDTQNKSSFSTQEDFSSHMSIEQLVPCTLCRKSFRGTVAFYAHHVVKHNDHEQSYHKIGPFACKVCNKIFANRSELMQHSCSGDTQRKEQGVYFCEKCNLELISWPDALSHWNKIHVYRCPVCKMGFWSPNTLLKHSNELHSLSWKCGEFGLEGIMSSKNPEESSDTIVKPSSSPQFAAKQKSVAYKYGRCSVKRKEAALKDSLFPNDNAFVCKLGMETFNTNESLTTHICDLEQCSLCMMTFSSKHQLEVHMKLHNINEGDTACLECEITFPSRYKYNQHIRNYHKGMSCEKCKRTFRYKSELDLHKCSGIAYSTYDGVPFREECSLSWTDAISHQNKTQVYVCGMCSESSMSQNTLTKHMKECEESSVETRPSSDLDTDEKIHLYKCCQCTVVLKSKDSLLEHMKMCVIKDISCCPESGMQSDSLSELQAHIRNSHAYKCDKCNVTFASRSEFEKHAASDHTGSIYNCLKCGMGFRKMSHVTKHSLEAHNINTFKNDKFGKIGVEKSREGLRVQMNEHSVCSSKISSKSKGQPFCKKCKLGFKSWTDAISHQNKTHMYVCGMCFKRFMTPRILGKHMKECKGMTVETKTPFSFADDKVYIYKCSCSMIFRSKDVLVEHMKVCVTKELITQCSECGLRFDSLSEMQVHTCNSHVHKCDKCGVTFANRSQFEKHLASVHAGPVYDCGARVCDVVSDEKIRESIRQYGSGKGTKSNLGITSSEAEVILPN